MIEKYENFLEKLGFYLDKYFSDQAPYIHCKKGCSVCCENGLYPLTKIEFDYLIKGYQTLDENKKTLINEKIKKIKIEKNQSKDFEYTYICPFLEDEVCSVYDYRGIICRTHGLLFFVEDMKKETRLKIPHCANLGLNYHQVFDEGKKTISSNLWKDSKIEVEPLSYNLDINYLTSGEIARECDLHFQQHKAMIDWFEA